jgi:hypothetical protein
LSAGISNEKLKNFISRHSEKDLRVLILFKLIKNEVLAKLSADGRGMQIDQQALDTFCLDRAKQLATLGKDPNEEDITTLIGQLTEKKKR